MLNFCHGLDGMLWADYTLTKLWRFSAWPMYNSEAHTVCVCVCVCVSQLYTSIRYLTDRTFDWCEIFFSSFECWNSLEFFPKCFQCVISWITNVEPMDIDWIHTCVCVSVCVCVCVCVYTHLLKRAWRTWKIKGLSALQTSSLADFPPSLYSFYSGLFAFSQRIVPLCHRKHMFPDILQQSLPFLFNS